MTLTTLLIPTYTQMLSALAGWLHKIETQPDVDDTLLSARLYEDMFPLATQVRFCCVQAYEAVHRLRGEELPAIWHTLVAEGQAVSKETSLLSDARDCIEQTLMFLDALEDDAVDDGVNHVVEIKLPNGMIFDMTGEQYVRDWALPQFYFHLNTAYAILRNNSLPLGKADYVQHAFKYLRPETMPATA